MGIVHSPETQVAHSSGAQTTTASETRSEVVTGNTMPRLSPPFAFEVEEFHSQIPDDDWRHRHGVPQILDFP